MRCWIRDSQILKRIGRAKNGYQLATKECGNAVLRCHLSRKGLAPYRSEWAGRALGACTGTAMPVAGLNGELSLFMYRLDSA